MKIIKFLLGVSSSVVIGAYYLLLIVTLPFLVAGLILVTTVNLFVGTWEHTENLEFIKDSLTEHLEPFRNRDC